METKQCTKCKEEKELFEFSPSNYSKDKRHYRCKKCVRDNKRIKNELKKVIKDNFLNSEFKKCNFCGIKKPPIEFHRRKQSKDGYHFNCKICVKENQKYYYSNNKEKQKEISKKFKYNNPTYLKEYYMNNKERMNKLTKINNKKRRLVDPLFRLKGNIRSLINTSFKYKGFKKNTKNEIILGCDKEYLKKFLESKFEPWMNWENYGKYNGEFNYGWDIDHIIPLSSAQTEEEFIKLNHHTNLQPLCSKINRDVKKGKIDY